MYGEHEILMAMMDQELKDAYEKMNASKKESMDRITTRHTELNAALEALQSCEDYSESDPAVQKINQELDKLLDNF